MGQPTKDSRDAGSLGAQSVHRALEILFSFSSRKPSQTLSEIATTVGLKPPTAHRLLKALQTYGLVTKLSGDRGYTLGPGIMRLSGVILQRGDVISVVIPELQQLREKSGESVGLHWRVADRRVCVVEFESFQSIRMTSGVGNVYPLDLGAPGKAICAFMSPDALDELNLSRVAQLTDEFADIRKNGYAVSRGESVPGAVAIAVPLFDSVGTVIGSINVTGPATRFRDVDLEKIRKPLREAANNAMRNMGFLREDSY